MGGHRHHPNMTQQATSQILGNCYEAAARHILLNVELHDDSWKLCHGVCINSNDGMPFGHCWLEWNDSMVIHMGKDNQSVMPIDVHYKVSKALETGHAVFKYTPQEAIDNMDSYEHFGPWDSKPPR